MTDRFPLLVVGLLVLVGALGAVLMRGAHRGDFADRLSTYRSSPGGARALYLVLAQQRHRVSRLEEDLELLPPEQQLVLLGVRFEDETVPEPTVAHGASSEADAGVARPAAPADDAWERWTTPEVSEHEWRRLLAHVATGATVVVALAEPRESPFLSALEASVSPGPPPDAVRSLVPAQPSRYTRGAQRLAAPVAAVLHLPPNGVPLLLDADSEDVVAGLLPWGAGRVILLGAPALAMNQHLAKADNARFWSSLVGALAERGPVAFDEYHHGFDGERSIGAFAARYGLQYAVAQLLVGVLLWALSLRRFGRPRQPVQELRIGSTDLLLATSRLYREGRHHAHAAQAITRRLIAEMAARAGRGAQDDVEAIARALEGRGRPQLARALRDVVQQSMTVTSDEGVRTVARLAALAHRHLHHTSRTTT